MSKPEEVAPRQEIIIVRRGRNDEDDAHHGGVWKIAFADFMTALMCFFLVMWLINAANEETRAALASYFNPVKLIDRNASRKGLEEQERPQPLDKSPEAEKEPAPSPETKPSASAPEASKAAESKAAAAASVAGPRSDEKLFSDPYAVLAEIAADTGIRQNTSDKGDGGAQTSGPASGASGGESYRDPFAPDFWSQQVAAQAGLPADEIARAIEAAETAAPVESGQEIEAPAAEIAEIVTEVTPPRLGPVEPEAEIESATLEPAGQEPVESGEIAAAEEAAAKETERAAEAIREALKEALGDGDELGDGFSVEASEDGVLISITDQIESGMFEIGSAVPRRDLVIAMEKIAKILSGRPGRVAINGHTDGRPFKSENYDNWRLSTARAHSAYFMLLRGGLAELRVMEVAGFADRKLKIAKDPLAAANRRIEILLERGG